MGVENNEKNPENSKSNLEKLKISLITREGVGNSAKDLLGFNLEQTNLLAGINNISELSKNIICEKNLKIYVLIT
ncbi:MAG: hypothetical protein Q9M97_01455 [Candidatus Gracilibacteria bacterium]|nr:hypothetical protein [Candidatus Gracilibacteria bacterium]